MHVCVYSVMNVTLLLLLLALFLRCAYDGLAFCFHGTFLCLFLLSFLFFFFFSSRRRHTRSDRDWSSDVCSSDLARRYGLQPRRAVDVRDGGERGPVLGADVHRHDHERQLRARRHLEPTRDRKSVV